MGDIISTVINMLNFVSSCYFLFLWFLKPCCEAKFCKQCIFSTNMPKNIQKNIDKKKQHVQTKYTFQCAHSKMFLLLQCVWLIIYQ
ncbi:hypothetical protein AB205_0203190 [Aquarana catesbeiana]|uniref:Uncharacterized protein n=1 Tax=Aquarana catesbeiana TaxID=8400 RepID=A0A2G9Q3A9_AQUCT|nr:hypothetical protein AB205_0203190 [Aquarana catesbeiana]